MYRYIYRFRFHIDIYIYMYTNAQPMCTYVYILYTHVFFFVHVMLDIHMVHFCIYIYTYIHGLGPHSRTSYQCWTTGACHSVNLSLECLRIACLQLKAQLVYTFTRGTCCAFIYIYTLVTLTVRDILLI